MLRFYPLQISRLSTWTILIIVYVSTMAVEAWDVSRLQHLSEMINFL